jgi:hypothetical protein
MSLHESAVFQRREVLSNLGLLREIDFGHDTAAAAG